jgi:hypothetical protein
MTMDDLDQLLRSRAKPVPVPDALMARILADAAREQPRPAPHVTTAPQRPAPARGLWQAMSDLFGGGGVLAGLASLACFGVYLGAAQPSGLTNWTQTLLASNAVDELDFMPSIDMLLAGE